MSYNGSGTFTIINTFVPNTTILSAAVNQNYTDIATGLSTAICKDGQQTLTANIPFANFKITGLGNGSARTDSTALGQVQDGEINWVAAGGTADAITATYSPALTTLTDGQLCFFRATAANASTTPTFAPNGLTAHTITKKGGGALIAGDIPAANAEVILRYNLANTRWELLNPVVAAANPPPASFKNLVIKVATTTTVSLAADFITVTDGTNYQTLAFSSTINLGTTGANALDTGTIAIDSWYYIWAIAKPDGTAAGLASLSGTAPTMPSGYTYKARVGAVLTIHASATLYGTWQFGRKAQYVVGLAQTSVIREIQSGNSGSPSVPTWTAFSISNYAPTTASSVRLCLSAISGTVGRVMAAPNNSYGNYASTTNPPPLLASVGSSAENHSIVADFILESTNVYFAADLTTGTAILSCLGWEDNI